ncbi:MAG TPA: DUF5666 domain-containing protein [Pseudolabrys sp.]|uniref:DUF5666 domain-containing protein n=1 Tax=Pseudolabrys sp. TaxID=1960880 RepID=UPI002DDCCEBF|nr:DUF5666 domain-containing protein [Pseudolabrys sp.]HEV2627478.1 DUF5666 domain-containing protein [Pseudolabrys sp.]
MTQHRNRTRLLAAIATLFALSPLPALAATPINLRGTITSISGNTIDIKETDGSTAAVRLADDAAIVSVAKASLSDIKPGSYIGTAATPRTDGTLQAIEVHIFPKSMRGAGEGTRAWDLKPKSSMTNGTVGRRPGRVTDNKVNKVEGNTITVDYKGGAKVVEITPSTKVVSLEPGNRAELKPDARIFVVGATKNGDGSLEAHRITVGTKDLPPPM